MIAASCLLVGIGVLGAADILFFHTLAQHLHEHRPARAELVTHALRGPTYCVLFLAVPNLAFSGGWLYALLGLLAFDLAISVADFWLEPASRRALGGLPRGEYLLHVFIALLFGAFVAAVLFDNRAGFGAPSAIGWASDGVPQWLRALLAIMAAGVLASGLSDCAAVRRLGRRPA